MEDYLTDQIKKETRGAGSLLPISLCKPGLRLEPVVRGEHNDSSEFYEQGQ